MAFCLGAGEIVEHAFLAHRTIASVRLAHTIRGVVSSAVTALVVGWSLVSSSPPLLVPTSIDRGSTSTWEAERARAAHYAQWLIQMRWVVTVFTTAMTVVAAKLTPILPREVWSPIITTIALLAATNVFYTALASRGPTTGFIELQLGVDLVILTLLLHFTGGVENPLSVAALFHVVFAGILLSKRRCYGIAALGALLFATMGALEWAGIAPHHALALFPERSETVLYPAREPVSVLSHTLVQASALFLIAYFASTLAERMRGDEHRLEMMADRALAERRLLERSLDATKRAQEQLVRAGKMAAVGQLAGQVAHEVNNPIAIISGKGRLLLSNHRHEMSSGVSSEIEKIVSLADRVADIARGLLSYCRASPAAHWRLDVRLPARHALSLTADRARRLGIEIVDQLPPSPLVIEANAGELEQVFLNLLLNAVDSMPRGGRLVLSSRFAPLPDGRPGIAVDVEDTGTGISNELLERIWEPFFTTKAEGEGAGLGLSISQGLVKSQGGELGVRSVVGQGTTFSVHLPLAGEPASEARGT